jgi:hypothetical protein
VVLAKNLVQGFDVLEDNKGKSSAKKKKARIKVSLQGSVIFVSRDSHYTDTIASNLDAMLRDTQTVASWKYPLQ